MVIEAGAMGLPQVVTDINGANEIIMEGVMVRLFHQKMQMLFMMP